MLLVTVLFIYTVKNSKNTEGYEVESKNFQIYQFFSFARGYYYHVKFPGYF